MYILVESVMPVQMAVSANAHVALYTMMLQLKSFWTAAKKVNR